MPTFKHFIKNIVYTNSFLRKVFVLIYKTGGRRPWSLGYSVYKYEYMRAVIENRLGMFQPAHLEHGYGFGLDERAVEYPWFFSCLKDHENKILDAGSALNHALILGVPQLKGRSLSIVTLADEGKPKSGACPRYFYEDLRKLSFPDNFFDAVVSISTLEHVGMDNTLLYTEDRNRKENDPNAYLAAVREIKRALKSGGSFYVTVPFGRYQHLGWLQVFDRAMVQKLIDEFSPEFCRETYFKYGHDQWNFSQREECLDGEYYDMHAQPNCTHEFVAAQCVVCLTMTKK